MVKKDVRRTTGFVRAEFNFWVGKYMDKFYDGLEGKKVVGNKCPKCEKVFVPPRKKCGTCFETLPLDEMVEVSTSGTLVNYTATGYAISEVRTRKLKKPKLIGMVKLDGTDTALIYPLLNVAEEDVKTGMKVELVWNRKLGGNPSDIKGFQPVGGAA